LAVVRGGVQSKRKMIDNFYEKIKKYELNKLRDVYREIRRGNIIVCEPDRNIVRQMIREKSHPRQYADRIDRRLKHKK